MKICGLMKTTLLDYPEHVACTVFTGGCNFRCPFCHNSELLEMNLPSEYSEEEIFSFLEKRCHTLEGVVFTGGEPTLQPDLPDFIRRVKEKFGLAIKLDTNGINPGMLKEMTEEGLLSYVAMDIKAGADNYARVAGMPDRGAWFDRVMESKNYLLEGHVPYEFRTTVVGGLHTEEDFHSIAEMIEGADLYAIQCYKDSDNVLDRQQGFTAPDNDTLVKYRNIVSPHVRRCILRGVDIEL